MKLLLLSACIILFYSANATTYYFSSSGNDSNDGTSASTPWKTLSKFNSVFASRSPGDDFLFKRGDVFYGNMIISRGGTSAAPITIGAYGSGANPVITGFTTVSSWTSLGGNIWESTSAVSTLSTVNMVVINGVNMAMGRYPNSGYLTYTSPSTTTKTVSGLGATNWTGATAVMRLHHWVTDNNLITAHSGNILTHTTTPNPTNYPGISGYGLFIQNDAKTLDVQNEWYYNPSTKKLRIYSNATPTNVQVTTIDTLVKMTLDKNYVTFENIKFTGSNKNHFTIMRCSNVTIQNCQFDYAGQDAIWGGKNGGVPGSPNIKFINNTINHTNNNGLILASEFTNALIKNNIFKNTALQPGMGKGGDEQMMTITLRASGGVIEYNTIDSSGYIPINFAGNNLKIRYNFINEFNRTKMDGGGIYTYVGAGAINTGVRIHHNIVLNSYPSTAGTSQTVGLSHGIYLDVNTQNIQVDSNTVGNMSYGGLYIYAGARNNNIFGNTFYNGDVTQFFLAEQSSGNYTINNTATDNIFFAKTATQKLLNIKARNTLTEFVATMGTFRNNYYARPIDDATATNTFFITSRGPTYNHWDLTTWKAQSDNDAGSLKSPKPATIDDIRFEYNATPENKTISLDGNYIDVKKVSYNGSITLRPFQSAVLIRNGAATNQSPTANAGGNQSITLPTNTVNLTGTGTDEDGSITAYNWTKISGPSSGTITNASSAATTVVELVQGIYQFELKVTDNNGAIAKDTMRVTVNASANVAPTANTGADQTITLPTNTVNLSGSGTDGDGSISAYNWTKVSGPSSGTITNASSAATTVTALSEGVYQFELKVTDNNGATAKDTIQVTVNAAGNVTPTANTGADQTITLPTNTVNLSGSGTDGDGSISAYNWTKVSGPASGTITNASSAATTVTELSEGVYQFELEVTDNNGATAKDTIQVTVNAAGNVTPTANTGADQTITLPTNTVDLSGSGTDDDGSISAYNWTKVSGPASGTITNASSAATTVTALSEGVYQFELKVTDNDGATAKDTIQVTVNAAGNVTPTANTGADQTITLPTNTVDLSGSGTDDDGSISAYNWTKISGPSSGTITDASSASTTATELSEGVYQFELEVTDNNGATARDTIQVTVNTAANVAPTANTGADQTITLPTNTVDLSGSGTDDDGSISAYNWTKISGPSSGTITDASSASTTVTELSEGVYQFELEVTDNNGATARDTIQVTVIVNPTLNILPEAKAGSDITITLPNDRTTVSGVTSTDADGSIVSYTWAKIGGPSQFNIGDAEAGLTSITNLIEGTYTFRLLVTDNDGGTDTDTILIKVNPAPPANLPPVAQAGVNQTITLPDNNVSLNGSASTDQDGTITSYTWTYLSGPTEYLLTDATSATASVSGMVVGTYSFKLEVTDNEGAVDADIVEITVKEEATPPPPPNVAPFANAGNDIGITLPVNQVTLDGRSSVDSDGTITNYRWKKINGPASFNLVNASSASTIIQNLVEGTYLLELQVKDNDGALSNDTIRIKVNPAPNQKPESVAGPDKVVKLPNPYIQLTGNYSYDPDGTVTQYYWEQVSGPNTVTITDTSSSTTTVTGVTEGTYQFQLTVTDNDGTTGSDIIQVIVKPAEVPAEDIEKSDTIALKPGKHTYSVSDPKQAGKLKVTYSGTGVSKKGIPPSKLYSDNSALLPSPIVVKGYPNPFNSYINISVTGGVAGEYKLVLVDASGRIVWTKTGITQVGDFQQQINAAALKNGIYFMNVIQKKNNTVIKLVK